MPCVRSRRTASRRNGNHSSMALALYPRAAPQPTKGQGHHLGKKGEQPKMNFWRDGTMKQHKTMLVIIPRALQVVCRDCSWFQSGKDVHALRKAGKQHGQRADR